MKKKRLLSLMLAVLMLFSVIGNLPAKASSTKTQTVGVTGVGTYTGGFTDTSWNLWVTVSPDVTTVDNWAWPGDEWPVTVFVDGAPYTAIVHYQSATMLNFWFATNLGTPAEGTEFTIKAGTYASAGNEGNLVIDKDYTYEFAGGLDWTFVKAIEKTQTVGVTGVGTYTGGFTATSWNLWVTVSPDVTIVDNWAWPGDEWPVSVVVNGVPYTAIVHYQAPSMLNFWFATNLGTPATGTEFTIKAGTYKSTGNEGNLVIDKDYTYQFAGGLDWTFVSPVEKTQTVGVTEMGIHGYEAAYWNLWVGVSPSLTIKEWTWNADQWTIPVLVNDAPYSALVNVESVNALNFYFDTNLGTPPSGTKFTIKAGEYASAGDEGILVIDKDYTFEYVGSAWVLASSEIVSLKFTGLDGASAYSAANNRWDFYLIPDKALPGTADQSNFPTVKAQCDGQEITIQLFKASHNNTAYFSIANSIVPEKPSKNINLVIKAGEYRDALTGALLVIEEDFTLYGNQHGWSDTGHIVPPKVTGIQFVGINNATKYDKNSQSWHLYLTPNTTIPGIEDKTAYAPANATVGGVKTELSICKASHEGTAFVMIPSTILPEIITKNTEIVIKAGTIMGNDSTNVIKLEKDFVIYANQYGLSLSGFLSAPEIKSTNVTPTLDRDTVYGGDEKGLYLNTSDAFKVDESWKTSIKAVSYDSNSGIFYNDQKVDAIIKRYSAGKMYLALSDAGITAKDKDKVTIKGTFVSEGIGVIYKETTFYFNGKIWNTKYEAAKPETYTKITAVGMNSVSGWTDRAKGWNLYIDVEGMIPGQIDKMYFDKLTVEVNGKKIETRVFHSYQDTLYVPISEKDLPKNAKDGIKITVKAGKALASDRTTGIRFTKDFTVYTYKGTLSEEKPTNDTKWLKTPLKGTHGSGYFNRDANMWYILFETRKDLVTEQNTIYAQLPLEINGKTYYFTARQQDGFLRVEIPTDIIPANTMSNMKVELKKGAQTWANAGRNGVEFTSGWVGYVYNYAILDHEGEEIKDTTTAMQSVQYATQTGSKAGDKVHHIYLLTDRPVPGEAWDLLYTDLVIHLNGKAVTTSMSKAVNSNDLLVYFPVIESIAGEVKDGDIITIKPNTSVTSGETKIIYDKEFKLIYKDNIWSEYIVSDAVKPEKTESLWEAFRFEDGFVPVEEEAGTGSVLQNGDATFNTIYSMKMYKDYTMKFSVTKNYDDEVSAPCRVILRGTPMDEEAGLDPAFLNGYVLTLDWSELEESNGEKYELQTLGVWKNGRNEALVDTYRVHYDSIRGDHPMFEYGKTYNYEISIWNVNETTVCIEVLVNDRLITRYYDHAGSDAKDPAINEGTFAVVYGCPSYLADTVDTSLTEVISAVDECVVGEEVQCAVTYPYVVEGSEFTVDKEGATIKNGIFVATKAGTYTISGSYKGTKLADKTIVVKEAPVEETGNANTGNFPIVPVAVAGGIVLLATVGIVVLLLKKRRMQ